MKLLIAAILIITSSIKIYAQVPIDTIVTENGNTMVIFDDRSWVNLDEIPFNGVMNPMLQKYLASKNITHPQPWNNESCFTTGGLYNPSSFNDTIPLKLNVQSDFVIPVPGVVTSGYKYRWRHYHKGIDLNLNTGDTVVAAWGGKVRYAKYNTGGYGNLVVIRHNNGLETFYGHLSKVLVSPNDEVTAGDVIGLGGNTGHSYGAHLHFEVRFYDMSINPEEIIDFQAKALKKDTLLICHRTLRPGATPTDNDIINDSYGNTQYVAAVSKPASTGSSKGYYKVKSGDSLSKIAARNNTTIAKICQLNGIRQNAVLQVGRTLRIR